MCMKYIIYSAHMPIQALNPYRKIIYRKSPLKSFNVCLCIVISVWNGEFESEVLLDGLGDHRAILAHFRWLMVADNWYTVSWKWIEEAANENISKIALPERIVWFFFNLFFF